MQIYRQSVSALLRLGTLRMLARIATAVREVFR